MAEILTYLRGYAPGAIAARFLAAAMVGGLIGLERGRHGRAAGMRTHILVCLGATMTTALGGFSSAYLGNTGDPMRIGAQVVSGIGFLGVGTILVRGQWHITGLTTAAGLWATAAVGLALGAGFYEGALICALMCYAAIGLLTPMDRHVTDKHRNFIYLELDDAASLRPVLDHLVEKGLLDGDTHVDVTGARSGIAGHMGLLLPVRAKKGDSACMRDICRMPSVVFALWE